MRPMWPFRTFFLPCLISPLILRWSNEHLSPLPPFPTFHSAPANHKQANKQSKQNTYCLLHQSPLPNHEIIASPSIPSNQLWNREDWGWAAILRWAEVGDFQGCDAPFIGAEQVGGRSEEAMTDRWWLLQWLLFRETIHLEEGEMEKEDGSQWIDAISGKNRWHWGSLFWQNGGGRLAVWASHVLGWAERKLICFMRSRKRAEGLGRLCMDRWCA
jgi:hypothetical protein